MKQVAEVFTKKWQELGTAKKAAKVLGVNPKSFYNYAHGTDLPRIEVLRSANQKWGIKWNLMDASVLFKRLNLKTQEQLLLPLIHAVREEDVEVVEVVTGSDSCLRVKLEIRFSSEKSIKSESRSGR